MMTSICNLIKLLRALSSWALNVFSDGASTTSSGNILHCFTTLIVKNLFLTPSVNLPSYNLKPLPLVPSLQALLKGLYFSLLWAPCKYWKAIIRTSQSLLSFRLNNRISLSLSSEKSAPALWSLLWVCSGPIPAGLSCVEGLRAGNHIPSGISPEWNREAESPPLICWPHGFCAAQDTIYFLGYDCSFPACVQLLIHVCPQIFQCRAALNLFITQAMLILQLPWAMSSTLNLALLNLLRFIWILCEPRFIR